VLVISLTTASPRESAMSQTATLAPSAAERGAVAFPIPILAPVTVITRPSSLRIALAFGIVQFTLSTSLYVR
jgi:hypothetical protein